MIKTDHEKYIDAEALVKKLKDIPAEINGLGEHLHKIGSRCQWCQENLNTWLLFQIYKRVGSITASVAELEGKLRAKGVIE